MPEIELNINAELIRELGKKNFKSRISQINKLLELPDNLKIKSKYCVVVPGASWVHKMWSVSNYIDVVSEISKKII